MSTPRRPDPTDPADDTERDAWLSEALRHAPDARTAPSAALSESILRQARAATRPSPATAEPRGALAAAWAWLVRPPVAAGFASLLVATTVGVMWWDRPLDETLVRPPVAATSPQPDATPQSRVAAAPAADIVAPPSATASREQPAARQARPRSAESKAVPPEPERARAAEAASPAAAPPAAAPPAAALTARRLNTFEHRPPALTALIEAVATQPERWTWQRSGEPQPMNPALQRWLAQLDNAAASRWRSTTDPTAPAVPAASVLRLYRDGALTATLSLTDDAVWLAPASRAVLPGASITALREALDAAAP